MFDPNLTEYSEYNKGRHQGEVVEMIDLLYRSFAADGHKSDREDKWRAMAANWLEMVQRGLSHYWLVTPRVLAAVAQRDHHRLNRSLAQTTRSLFLPDGVARPRSQELWPQKARLILNLRNEMTTSPDLWSPSTEGMESPREVHWGWNQPLKGGGPLFAVFRRPWLPKSELPMLVEAREYSEEVRRLQATKAGRKAKRLLMDHLTEEQRRDYYTKGVFTVLSADDGHEGDRRYYVLDNSYPQGNIFEIRKGQPVADLCFHPAEPHPMDDILLCQKVAIETDEIDFRKKANRAEHSIEQYYMPSLNGYPLSLDIR